MKRLVILIAVAAASVSSAFGQNFAGIGGWPWQLTYVKGITVGNNSSAYLEVNHALTKFSGTTGCNRMFGAVDVQGRRLDFSNIGTTKMACRDPRARRVETVLVKALEKVDRYRQHANILELYDRDRLVLKFAVPIVPPADSEDPISLEDRKWTLDSIGSDPATKLGKTAFLVFDKTKQSAGGNSSCNVFGGSYTTKGSALKIAEVVSTMRACIEDERMSIERQFLDGLQKANRYEIAKGKLMLYRDKRLLLTFVGERK